MAAVASSNSVVSRFVPEPANKCTRSTDICRGELRPQSQSRKVKASSLSYQYGSRGQKLYCFRARDRRHQRPGRLTTCPAFNLDAAQFFDSEAQEQKEREKKMKMKIGVIGFGNFGQFIAQKFIENGHEVLGYSRGDYSADAKALGATYYNQIDDFCEEHPDIVVFATSILSTEKVLRSLPVQRLRRNTLFVDVLSVKVFPKQLFLQVLPPYFDICCLHPMFGPQSGKNGWDGLPLVYDKVRVIPNRDGDVRLDTFLGIWEKEGCRMVEMTCEEHDRRAASSQFITHTVGRVLSKMELDDTDINTKGYDSLLALMENTTNDSFELYYGLFMYNPNATEELQRMERAFDDVKKQLFDRLSNVVRQQLFHGTDASSQLPPQLQLPNPSMNGSDSKPATSESTQEDETPR
mmetsp:Transcript_19375/g.23153  ORF Transcript_19375/g.23153 Transcript_19375/m.23153 type:complete len:407 (+) Transcript_19375:329-1549(+)|eukprot:CAMPEP_0197845852 /NCGR_PEP_ID=MMETSP1438-20131217/2717_1 /TAXON_ID=1461541 /ORGANISM="Pterosperma sp., Strain CCMP1384" /LENGTH=406 /DNA_ID=CAMNT_0043457299 /DNA_START=328 /DNA_END=1548 /DNA_ORIENTATION=+